MGIPLINEIGNSYGALKVEQLTKDKDGRTAWLCRCKCGNTKIVRGPDLRKGRVTSCGCRINAREKRIDDLAGKIFGYLQVIERDDTRYDHANKENIYKCLCTNCNSICYIRSKNLKSGHTKSCGCKTKELLGQVHRIDETGQVYGELTVQELVNYDGRLRWKCKCSCGNITYVEGAWLRSGNTKSCGCKRGNFSHEAKEIENFLKEQKINYKTEYTFSDLVGNSKPLRFDFAIFNENNLLFCIEYNGRQHYEHISYFGDENHFLLQQKYDNLKKEYCYSKQIPLLILPYTNTHQQNINAIIQLYNTKRWS